MGFEKKEFGFEKDRFKMLNKIIKIIKNNKIIKKSKWGFWVDNGCTRLIFRRVDWPSDKNLWDIRVWIAFKRCESGDHQDNK